MNTKNFSSLSPVEREEWLAAYQSWLSSRLPEIEKAPSITAAVRSDIEAGLELLSAFPFCRSFVAESLRFKNYASRLKLLRRYADKVTEQVQTQLKRNIDLTDPNLLTPHVGRPSKMEAAARALKAEQERLAAEKAQVTLFGGTVADIPTDTPPAPATVSGSLVGSDKLHLDQLRWLLSPTIQEAVDTVRDLRARAAEAATTAKALAEAGKPEEEVAPYASDAAKFTEEYELIYERVDDELSRAYVRLKEDKSYIAAMEERKINPTELRSVLRPYWDKVEDKDALKASVIDFIKANDPEQAAIREAEEKKKKAAADIIKYLTRKDKKNTQKRIATMEARFAELKELIGEEEANTYLPVLNAAREDCARLEAEKAAKNEATKEDKQNTKKDEATVPDDSTSGE